MGLVIAKCGGLDSNFSWEENSEFLFTDGLYNLGNPGATGTIILTSYMESTSKSKEAGGRRAGGVGREEGRSFLNDFFEIVILDLYTVKRIKNKIENK